MATSDMGCRSTPSKRVFAVIALLAGWIVLAVAGATPALAHATFSGSDPAENSRLDAVPSKVTVTFSEDVTVGAGLLTVLDKKGNAVSIGAAVSTGREVSVPLKPGLADGNYVVSYRMLSADSHPVSGAYAFVVGAGPLVSPSGSVSGSTDGFVNKAFAVVRFLSFAGVVLFAGIVFVVLCWSAGRTDRRARKLVTYGWWAASLGTALSLVLQGPYTAGDGWVYVFNSSLLKTTLGTMYGRMLCARLILLGVLAVLAMRIMRKPRPTAATSRIRDEELATICGLGLLVTFAGVGHAAAGSARTVALLSDSTHLAAASVWLGGLIMLTACLLPRGRSDELARALPTFSRLAIGCVTALALTGTFQAWREVWPVPALWSTSYGQLLLAKIIGFVLMVAVAFFSRQAVNRRYVRPVVHALSLREDGGRVATIDEAEPTAVAEDRRTVRWLRASVGIELVLGVTVLALAAVLVATAPARSTFVRSVDQTVRLSSGGAARVEITPAKVGSNTLSVDVLDAQGNAVNARSVTATVALPPDHYGPLTVPLQRVDVGRYRTSSASLTKTGTWELVVRVQTSEFDRDVVKVDVPVG